MLVNDLMLLTTRGDHSSRTSPENDRKETMVFILRKTILENSNKIVTIHCHSAEKRL